MKRISEIIPLIEQGLSYKEIAKRGKVSHITVHRWVKRLREAGHTIEVKVGRKSLPL